MRKEWYVIPIIVLTLSFATASMGIAGQSHHGHKGHKMKSGHRGLKGFLELKLTQDQQTEMLKIIDKYHNEKEQVKARLWEAKENLTRAIYAEKFDEEGIRNASREVSSIKEEMAVLRAKMFGELKTVLTPEQIDQFREMKSHKYGG